MSGCLFILVGTAWGQGDYAGDYGHGYAGQGTATYGQMTHGHGGPVEQADPGHGFVGPASVGSGEPLFYYDDQERWKHGYLQIMPFYGGFFSFRPYNYHHVIGQSQTAAGWGMPAVMPYSQQFWNRYRDMTDLSQGDHSPVVPVEPPPEQFDHYPQPIHGTWNRQPPREPAYRAPYGRSQDWSTGPAETVAPVRHQSYGAYETGYGHRSEGPSLRPQGYDQAEMQRYFESGH
jgi:hypothetical protein